MSERDARYIPKLFIYVKNCYYTTYFWYQTI